MNGKVVIVDECEVREEEVSMDTTFAFPEILSEHFVLGKHLIIASQYANWLVCDDNEYAAFRLFRDGKSIQEVEDALMAQLQMSAEDARGAVSRLMAQVFERDFSRDAEIITAAPLDVSLRLTSGCNLRCTICSLHCTTVGPDECSFEQWRRFLDALKQHGADVLTISGGEPLVNPDCVKIIVYAKKIGFRILLLTNGTLITNENAEVIGKNCDQIRISIDGPDEATHDSIRGKGMFGKAVSALHKLVSHSDCRLTITMTPTPATLPAFRTGLRKFVDWIRQTIRSDISFEVNGMLMPGRELPAMSREEQVDFLETVNSLCNDQLETDFAARVAAVNVVPNRPVFDCGLKNVIPVDANGDVHLCSIFGSLCNIKEIGDSDGVDFVSRLVTKLDSLVDSIKVDRVQLCSSCDLRYFCGGGCRKENLRLRGNLNASECTDEFRQALLEKLVTLSLYTIEPLT